MPSISGMAANAGNTIQTRFTSRKPSRGSSSRWLCRVSTRISSPTPSASAIDTAQTPCRSEWSSPSDHPSGTRNISENPTKMVASTWRTGTRPFIADQKNVALTWNIFSTARSWRLFGT